ncbi:MAG: replication factor C large subunit, partial [Thermoprotei archaeon]
EICRRIASKCHVSRKCANAEVLPFLRVIFEGNPKMAAGIAKWLDLSEDMIRFIVGDRRKAKEIVKYMRK